MENFLKKYALLILLYVVVILGVLFLSNDFSSLQSNSFFHVLIY